MASLLDDSVDLRTRLKAAMGGFVVSTQRHNRQFKVLVLGQISAHKTHLLDLLAGLEGVVEQRPSSQAVRALRRRTQQVTGALTRTVSIEGVCLQFLDTPGFADHADGVADRSISRHVDDALQQAQYFHCVLLLLDNSQPHAPASISRALRTVVGRMPEDILDKVIVVLSGTAAGEPRSDALNCVHEVLQRHPPVVVLENPLGKLAGLTEAELKRRMESEDLEGEVNNDSDIRPQIRKAARSAVELLRTIKDFEPTEVNPDFRRAKATAAAAIGVASVAAAATVGLPAAAAAATVGTATLLADRVDAREMALAVAEKVGSAAEAMTDAGRAAARELEVAAEPQAVECNAHARAVLAEHPGRVPVVCEPAPCLPQRSGLPALGDIPQQAGETRFLVPGDMSCGVFKLVVHRRLMKVRGTALSPTETIYLHVNGVSPRSSAMMSEVYSQHKAKDGFLRLTYSLENTLG